MKRILGLYSAPEAHWVGDGFPVRSLFSYQRQAQELSPFLLLDYAGPMQFTPASQPRGVGQHPHRGFETVTIVYEGEVEHRDSSGGGGTIGPGDVQWMTAGAGIVHEEFHSSEFTRSGGLLEMVQLWVNLPARHKMAPARYQTLLRQDIPTVVLPDGAGQLRVVAGEYGAQLGPARTFTSLDVWDLRLQPGRTTRFAIAPGRTLALIVLRGSVRVNERELVRDAQLVTFDRAAGDVVLTPQSEAQLLLLGGEPIDEPVVGYGPFVMNSQQEIRQAIGDFNSGLFGQMRNQEPV
jgi:redox-sensitive bicupin YhaK (pirin superfamily)